MAQILDQFGNPIKRSELLEEQATPSTTGVRSIRSNMVSYGLTPEKVSRLLREADDGDIEAYLELAEEIEEKDPHYHSVLGTRKRQVAQLDITVEPASEDKNDIANAKLIEDWLKRDTLEDELFDILDAIGKSFSVTEILWDTSEGQWMPGELKWRDPRWFKPDRENGETLRLRTETGEEDLSSNKFIIHRHRAKSGLTIRGGLIRPVLWMYLFKVFSIKDWVTFAEAYGQPIRVGKYGKGASREDIKILKRAVANIGSDAAAVIPESMLIEFIESQNKSQTADVFERLCRYCDEQVSKAVLGQTMTTDDGSSRSQAEVHNEVKHDIERSDAKQLAATLNRQLVPLIVSFNHGPQKNYPRIRIGRSENVDIEKVTNAADKLVRMGAKISEKNLLEKTGFAVPDSDDDVLRLPAVAQPDDQKPQTKEDTAARKKHTHKRDAIDDLAEAGADDWEEVINPAKTIIERAAKESSSYEEFQQKLLELADNIDMGPMAEALAKANFAANLAGQVEYDIEGENDE